MHLIAKSYRYSTCIFWENLPSQWRPPRPSDKLQPLVPVAATGGAREAREVMSGSAGDIRLCNPRGHPLEATNGFSWMI